MLPVFSVILEYRKDGRNSSDRPTVGPQPRLGHSLCTDIHSALSLFQSKLKHVHLYSFEPYQLQLITEHAYRRAQMLN